MARWLITGSRDYVLMLFVDLPRMLDLSLHMHEVHAAPQFQNFGTWLADSDPTFLQEFGSSVLVIILLIIILKVWNCLCLKQLAPVSSFYKCILRSSVVTVDVNWVFSNPKPRALNYGQGSGWFFDFLSVVIVQFLHLEESIQRQYWSLHWT